MTTYGRAEIVNALSSVEMEPSHQAIYDRDIELRLLYQDPASGEEHYLVRYPPGLHAKPHRHTAAQTIVVLEGRLRINSDVIGPGSYCHMPPGEAMLHAPAGDAPCLFVTIFHGPFDVHLLEE